MDSSIKRSWDFSTSDSDNEAQEGQGSYLDPPLTLEVKVDPKMKGGFPFRPMSISEIFSTASGDTEHKEEIFLARRFIQTHITGSADPTLIRKKKNRKLTKRSLF